MKDILTFLMFSSENHGKAKQRRQRVECEAA